MNNSTDKLYNIEFDYRPSYLYVYVWGEKDSLEISRQYWREIAAECKKNRCSKLLIVEDIKEIVSLTAMYQIASEIPQLDFSGVRIAFVDRYIEQQTLNQFGEIVATNRGIYGKIFDSVEQAEHWLLKN